MIIDLDLSPNTIEEYQYSNTEKIFEALYPNFIRLTGNTKNHKIFTTGLIHREAYFVLPQLLDVYKEFYPKVMYRGKILELRSIYEVALSHILENRGLKKNYEVIKNRFTRLGMNLPENIMDLEEYCKENFFLKNSDLMPIELLLFSNIKELFWKELEFEGGNDIFLKDQLEMQIAKFFSSHLDEVFHIRHILDRICQPYHSEG
ncbi:MAG: hypothetical protein EAZ61_02000 [Oscillatoriales cyanobacterium]|nr:MAG: hypothetical protein EAZ61_02000 [Oscillatoriales cyanobacterium]